MVSKYKPFVRLKPHSVVKVLHTFEVCPDLKQRRKNSDRRCVLYNPKYENVTIVQVYRKCIFWGKRLGFMLAYDGEPSTGPFDTRQAALGWYMRGGR